jgi:hypothetical protein
VRHDVLQSVFPSCQTLHQFLLRFKGQTNAQSFLLATDTPAYRSLLTKYGEDVMMMVVMMILDHSPA